MKDQTDKLDDKGIEAAQVNSALTKTESEQSFERVREGSEFVMTTPERLASDSGFVDMLRQKTVARVVVDEAHCVSEWGHDFRPSFLEIKAVVDRFGRPPLLALTATATPQVVDDIVSQLGLRNPTIVNTGIYRPNLRFEVMQTASEHAKREHLAELLRTREGAPIVYAATITQVEALYTDLTAAGFAVERYHGKLSRAERREHQDRFINGSLETIVATNAFGMGIDRPDIRLVVHYAIPGSVEEYYQEAGRAGRDSADARCVLLFNAADQRTHKYFIASRARGAKTRLMRAGLEGAALEERLRQEHERVDSDQDKLARRVSYGQHPLCRWRFLLDYFSEPVAADFCCGNCDVCTTPLRRSLYVASRGTSRFGASKRASSM